MMHNIKTPDETTGPHHGAKVALFLGCRLLAIRRDDLPHIPYPDHWDLPGGGREGNESPFGTAARELSEELGLVLPRSAVLWGRAFASGHANGAWAAFFVAQLPAAAQRDIRFGQEGQYWRLFDLPAFLALDNVVPSFAARLALWQDAARDDPRLRLQAAG